MIWPFFSAMSSIRYLLSKYVLFKRVLANCKNLVFMSLSSKLIPCSRNYFTFSTGLFEKCVGLMLWYSEFSIIIILFLGTSSSIFLKPVLKCISIHFIIAVSWFFFHLNKRSLSFENLFYSVIWSKIKHVPLLDIFSHIPVLCFFRNTIVYETCSSE